jgi:hypothetical protein
VAISKFTIKDENLKPESLEADSEVDKWMNSDVWVKSCPVQYP